MKLYWQAKIWGYLHDPVLKPLHTNAGRGKEGSWKQLAVMAGWQEPGEWLKSADYIASASDRSAIGSLSTSLDYDHQGLEIVHLLSGAKQAWQIANTQHQELINKDYQKRSDDLFAIEAELIPQAIKEAQDERLVHWWLWRCLPEKAMQKFGENTYLMPAETRIPDASIWSHLNLTSALAGALQGYDQNKTRPYIAAFTFSPVQEMIKASRKMRDFWAGSWILHYLSARVCWAIAWKYGADVLVYPSLYAQPLIDYWLLHGLDGWEGMYNHPTRKEWEVIREPSPRALLTAGFPNVIVALLPQDKVTDAMQMAKQTMQETWQGLAEQVFQAIKKEHPRWMGELGTDSPLWQLTIKHHWQYYWASLPLGDPQQELRSKEDTWRMAQNSFYGLPEPPRKSDEDEAKKCMKLDTQSDNITKPEQTDKDKAKSWGLFLPAEADFLKEAAELREQKWEKPAYKANVGSWWSSAFDQLRYNLQAVKSGRAWQLPTAFGVRSTISGIGSVLHPEPKSQEESIKTYWQKRVGLFDGREMLNATEVTKRGLHKVLTDLFEHALSKDESSIDSAYPDLTAGVAGYLKQNDQTVRDHYVRFCQEIIEKVPLVQQMVQRMRGRWGIPYADEHLQLQHPRLLNAGWLLEDIDVPEEQLQTIKQQIQEVIKKYYPVNNPSDWYVIAAGDGDGMGEWLQGKKLKKYHHYIPQRLQENYK
ncbi:MAG: type III-B CRISPR-associated protein Cas10/Cmr2 [Pseudanabaenaceae cyanobacterium SKYGB_i_bin29]|nr:hypothetical protein [Pseudanabaenaceae cyanobacterium SKYG29]MDW8421640.1 type III-B CRISPR-associated protein Cas10/Cmr2 [Pseudanabaenaceae cyanobacterium SKYGB_i_bin29]